jgi:hypothetical protein
MTTIKGKLEPFFETGTEGIIWSVYEDGREGYDGLNCLADGDYLTVFDPADPTKVIWEGTIDFEWERNYRQYPMNPQYGQQEVGGFWVHGLQSDVTPAEWGHWFFKAYPAEMIKGPVPNRLNPVKNSSSVSGYHWAGRTEGTGKDFHWTDGDLIIKFKNGGYYKYFGIPHDLFWEFYEAESKGKFIAANFRDKFVTEKLELPKPFPKPPEVAMYPFPTSTKP